MSNHQDPKDRRLVALLIETLGDSSLRESEELVGLDHSTIIRFRAGTWKRLYPKSRRKILDFLEGRGVDVAGLAGGGGSGGEGMPSGMSPAEELIFALDHGVVGFLGEQSAEDVVKAGFAWAGVHAFPPAEMAKLNRWRDRKLGIKAERA